jgi:AraC-like DNA-binding protein
MSYYHFSRFFKKLTSKKFNEYLLELRLNSAQKKLLEENKSVSEVALECGFEYVSYFIQKFKERNGLTPREFQRKYRTAGQDPILLDRFEQTGVGFSTATVAPGNAVAASARAEGADAAETDSET